jgi:hypothetical protein
MGLVNGTVSVFDRLPAVVTTVVSSTSLSMLQVHPTRVTTQSASASPE